MSDNQRSSVRIISGTKRGSKIQFPDARGLRPSGDRIREALFAWLQSVTTGSHCLDMFAGSGALGFEAASRGADSVVMIEKNRIAARALKDNAVRLRFDNVDIFAADALTQSLYSNELADRQFDVVFIDPPFAENLHQSAIDLMHPLNLLKPSAFIYVEAAKKADGLQIPDLWELYREKVAGDVRAQLYRSNPADIAAD